MSSIVATRRRLESAETLQGVVTTMKTLSAVRINQYRRAVTALQESNRTLELAVQALLSINSAPLSLVQSSPDSSVAAVVLGSDRGLCGPFNERIARHVAGLLDMRTPAGQTASVLAVGRRLHSRLSTAGHVPDTQVQPPANVESIDDTVSEVLGHLDRWREAGRAERLYLAYNRPTRGASYEPMVLRILPVDGRWIERLRSRDWPSRRLPIALGEPGQLLRGLVRHFIAHSLVQAFAASQASENAARLAAMDAAERNIEERLTALRATYRQANQNAVTAELLDVQAAFAAASKE